jgi:hopene-associated glycosyltransferase HpnB
LLLVVLLAIGVVLWLACLAWNLYQNREAPAVSASTAFPPASEPRVSILIPARNEADILAKTLPAFLSQEYGDYEVILADDASTDVTGELAGSLAEKNPGRLRVVRIEDLPPGWVGKTHALHRAFEVARGEWVLATDADIVFHPKALRAGMRLANRERAELVSLCAFLECQSFWERLMMPVFAMMLATVFPLRRINNPRSSVAIASGGYILMRRSTWASLGGYEAIRGEMIDDLNTARRIKHSGRRVFVAITQDLVRTRMYESFSGVWEGLRKNAFAAHRFSVLRMSAFLLGTWFTSLLPVAALAYSAAHLAAHPALSGDKLSPQIGLVFVLSLAQYALSVVLHLFLIAFFRIPWSYALLAPFGSLVYSAIALDSMLRTLFGRGVSWKLRQYGKPSWQPEE